MAVEWKSIILAGDSRLTDSREWLASTVSQAEAEAGTAIIRRAWTAQRVAQAIDSLIGAGTTILTFAKIIAADSDLGSVVISAPFENEKIPTYSLDFSDEQVETVDLGGLI